MIPTATTASAWTAAVAKTTAASSKKKPLLFHEPIHILGAGAIGLLWAASIRCAFPNYPVKLLLRDKTNSATTTAAAATKNPKFLSICLRQGFAGGDSGSPLTPPPQQSRKGPRIVHVPCEVTMVTETTRKIRNLIVTTKAASAVSAIQSVQHRFHNNCDSTTTPTRIILLCNGALAVQDEWTRLQQQQQQQQRDIITSSGSSSNHPLNEIHLALTTHGAYREFAAVAENGVDDDDDLHHVVHAGYGHTVLQGMESMAVLWDMAGLRCTHVPADSDAMVQQLWYKLAANCVINPLTAIHNCPNGAILHLANFQSYYYPALLSEIARVYVAATTATDAVERTATAANSSPRLATVVEADFRTYVDGVIRDTAQNWSSMLQDVVAQRETEVDYLSGHVVRIGAQHNIPCPVHQELWQAVRALHHH